MFKVSNILGSLVVMGCSDRFLSQAKQQVPNRSTNSQAGLRSFFGSSGAARLSHRRCFKALDGRIDEAGGLVFRLKDAKNCYVVRENVLEDNFNLYKVVNRGHSEIKGSRTKVSTGQCQELRVEAIGNKITCYFDGAKQIEAMDNTSKEPGKIGLWTKADSVSYFDGLRATAKQAQEAQ